jgi:acyl carrier protein
MNVQNREQAVLEVLGVFLGKAPCDIDPDSQLSGLGLSSLIAVRLAYRLNQRYGLEITAAVLYEYSTPRQLAGYISRQAVVEG